LIAKSLQKRRLSNSPFILDFGVVMLSIKSWPSIEKKDGEIGELIGIDYSAVSVTRKRLSVLRKRDRNLSAGIEKIKKRLQSSKG
jgi:hypothetical protein